MSDFVKGATRTVVSESDIRRTYTDTPKPITDEWLADHGYARLKTEPKPDRVPAYRTLKLSQPRQRGDGSWMRQWVAVLKNDLTTVAQEKVREVEARYEDILNGGFEYDFGTKAATLESGSTEEAGVRTLQTRPHDRERWQATNQVASQYIGAGAPEEPMRPFRTLDNARVPMTAQDANACLNAMQAKFGKALDVMWDHKDAIRNLTTVKDVVDYDISTFWP